MRQPQLSQQRLNTELGTAEGREEVSMPAEMQSLWLAQSKETCHTNPVGQHTVSYARQLGSIQKRRLHISDGASAAAGSRKT